MAEIIPSFTGPNYLGQAADTISQFDTNSAVRLSALLKARQGALGNILSSSERVAGIGGSGALDQLLGQYASSDGSSDVFNTPYAQQMDDLRMIATKADIAATNRQGTGGGRGGGVPGGKPGQIVDTNGTVHPNMEAFQAAQLYYEEQGLPPIGIARFGTGPTLPTVGGSDDIFDQVDEDGRRYVEDANGRIYEDEL